MRGVTDSRGGLTRSTDASVLLLSIHAFQAGATPDAVASRLEALREALCAWGRGRSPAEGRWTCDMLLAAVPVISPRWHARSGILDLTSSKTTVLLLALCLACAPGRCVAPVISGAKKALLLPDVAPTLVNAKNAGVTNPGARPLAELNDRQKMGTTMAGVTQIGTSEHGVTVHLTAELSRTKANVYAVAGMSGLTRDGREKFLSLPAAFQVGKPFGVDIGGVSPAFFAVNADAKFDSWLTVGVTDGSAAGALATSPGLGLDRWSADAQFTTGDGAVSTRMLC